jgi:hypothetical protein
VFFLYQSLLFSQEKWSFKPFLANPFEGRVGSMYQVSNDKLRLDIGNSFDLLRIVKLDSLKINIGVDFFTLTLLRSEGNFKFPVETTDFYFGINSTLYLKTKAGNNYSFRVRIAHISSHLSDGLSVGSVFIKTPFVYSREFFELIGCVEVEKFRVYFGGNYIFSTLPKDIVRFNPQAGFDYEVELRKWLKFLIGVDTKATGYDSRYYLSSSIQAIFLFHQLVDKGFGITFNYFDGKNIHGMFYKEKDSYFAIGFQLFY